MLLLGALAVFAGCPQETGGPAANQGPAKAELPVLAAATMTLSEQPWPFIVRTQGGLVADEVSPIGSMVPGKVSVVHADLGDSVDEGTPLVTLDQQDFQLQLAQAEAQLLQSRAAVGLKPEEPVEKLNIDNAPPVRQEKAMWDESKARLERVNRLKSQNATTEEVVDTTLAECQAAEARYLSARNSVSEKIATIIVRTAELEIAKQRLANTVIKAPFSGQVQMKHVAPGTYVQVGSPLFTIVRSNPLRFRGSMPERYAQQVKLGQEITLQIESVADPIQASIDRISPSLDESNRSLQFEARVANDNSALRTGLFAEAEVVLDPESRALVLPSTALVEFAGAERVWKVVDGKSKESVVRTGQRRPSGIEILSGLSSGDVILVNGKEGKEARIVDKLTSTPVPESAGKSVADK